jgi:3-dehydroquinate dehydratase type I
MICVSIAEKTPEENLKALKDIDFAEIRIDRMERPQIPGIKKIFSQPTRLIATCRPGKISDQKRQTLLTTAISAGAAYVDIGLGSDERIKKAILEKARSAGCKVIFSYHNFKTTPAETKLRDIIEECFVSGADIAKIACMVHSDRDNIILLGLLLDSRPLVVIGMGEKGKVTRIAAPILGSPFTYASLSSGRETAAGQLDKINLEKIFQIINVEYIQ